VKKITHKIVILNKTAWPHSWNRGFSKLGFITKLCLKFRALGGDSWFNITFYSFGFNPWIMYNIPVYNIRLYSFVTDMISDFRATIIFKWAMYSHNQGVWNRREIRLTRFALPYDYTCFADGTPFVWETFRIGYCIRDKYFLFKWSTVCKACIIIW